MRLDHLLSKEEESSNEFFTVLLSKEEKIIKRYLVAMRYGVTPVLIPNTMVKAIAANGTILETVWESRWLPDFKKWAYSSAG